VATRDLHEVEIDFAETLRSPQQTERPRPDLAPPQAEANLSPGASRWVQAEPVTRSRVSTQSEPGNHRRGRPRAPPPPFLPGGCAATRFAVGVGPRAAGSIRPHSPIPPSPGEGSRQTKRSTSHRGPDRAGLCRCGWVRHAQLPKPRSQRASPTCSSSDEGGRHDEGRNARSPTLPSQPRAPDGPALRAGAGRGIGPRWERGSRSDRGRRLALVGELIPIPFGRRRSS